MGRTGLNSITPRAARGGSGLSGVEIASARLLGRSAVPYIWSVQVSGLPWSNQVIGFSTALRNRMRHANGRNNARCWRWRGRAAAFAVPATTTCRAYDQHSRHNPQDTHKHGRILRLIHCCSRQDELSPTSQPQSRNGRAAVLGLCHNVTQRVLA